MYINFSLNTKSIVIIKIIENTKIKNINKKLIPEIKIIINHRNKIIKD